MASNGSYALQVISVSRALGARALMRQVVEVGI